MNIGTMLKLSTPRIIEDTTSTITQRTTSLIIPRQLRIKNIIIQPRPNYWSNRIDFKSAEMSILSRSVDEINQP